MGRLQPLECVPSYEAPLVLDNSLSVPFPQERYGEGPVVLSFGLLRRRWFFPFSTFRSSLPP